MKMDSRRSHQVAAATFVTALSLLAGCGGGGGGSGGGSASSVPTGALVAGGASVIYAGDSLGNKGSDVFQFPLTASQNLNPTADIIGPTGTTLTAIATDSSGTIYAGGFTNSNGQGEVLVYPAGSTGMATPMRTILGATSSTMTTFSLPVSMAINSAGVLAITSLNGTGDFSVATMPATSSGAVTPTTLIQGTSTQLTNPDSISLDSKGNIYVSNYPTSNIGQVLVFATAANGNVAPTGIITTGTQQPYGVAVDPGGNIYVALDDPTQPIPVTAGSIVEFAAGASGAATPLKTLAGTASKIYYLGGLTFDSVGNLYAINIDSTNQNVGILAFGPKASGNIAPGLNFVSNAFVSGLISDIAVH